MFQTVICHVFLVGPHDRSEMKSNETICECLLQSVIQVGHVYGSNRPDRPIWSIDGRQSTPRPHNYTTFNQLVTKLVCQSAVPLEATLAAAIGP